MNSELIELLKAGGYLFVQAVAFWRILDGRLRGIEFRLMGLEMAMRVSNKQERISVIEASKS